MPANVKPWVESAQDDLDAAQAMHDTGRWSYVAFLCHQCVEKLLKAMVMHLTSNVPPPTHNLGFLLRKTGLAIPPDVETQVLKLAPHYFTSRYPDSAGGRPSDQYNRLVADELLTYAKEIAQWSASHLKSSP